MVKLYKEEGIYNFYLRMDRAGGGCRQVETLVPTTDAEKLPRDWKWARCTTFCRHGERCQLELHHAQPGGSNQWHVIHCDNCRVPYPVPNKPAPPTRPVPAAFCWDDTAGVGAPLLPAGRGEVDGGTPSATPVARLSPGVLPQPVRSPKLLSPSLGSLTLSGSETAAPHSLNLKVFPDAGKPAMRWSGSRF